MTRPDALAAAADALEVAAAALREAVRDRDPDGPPALLDVETAARRLGLGRTTFYRLVREDAIRTHRIGRRRLVSVAAIDEYAARDVETPAPRGRRRSSRPAKVESDRAPR